MDVVILVEFMMFDVKQNRNHKYCYWHHGMEGAEVSKNRAQLGLLNHTWKKNIVTVLKTDFGPYNRYIITCMLHQIFIYSKKVIIPAG